MKRLDTMAGLPAEGACQGPTRNFARRLAAAAGAATAGAVSAATVGLMVGTALGTAALLVPLAGFAQNAALPAVVQKADPAKGEQLATQVCAACHGADGNSTAPVNPKIAAQHPTYLRKQLADFKPKEGGKAAERPNPIMSPIAASLSTEDMANLSAYYASKPLKPSAARNKEVVDLGRDIYRGGIADKGVPSCAGCHGPTGSGIPGQYPRLGGQFSDYTEAQLVAFRSGGRHNNVSMTTIASRLSDREIKALSDYIAGIR